MHHCPKQWRAVRWGWEHVPPVKSFSGGAKAALGARHEAGNAVEMLYITWYSPFMLTKNDGCMVEHKKRNKNECNASAL